MLYVKTEDLKVGMRLARPIYSRNGTLLYERNSKLTHQGIISVRNFRIIGLYILEPAEPVPPMTKEDLEFERFQTMSVFSIQDELTAITKKQDSKKLNALANQIIKMYGNLYHKINFMQNLRSRSDYIYKHSVNTAILCALISHQLEFSFEEQMDVVTAALLHDIHKLFLPDELVEQEFRNQTIDTNDSHYAVVKKEVKEAQALLQSQVYISSNVKKIIAAVKPLDLDIAMVNDYLDDITCFRASEQLTDMVYELYNNIESEKEKKERKELVDLIGNPYIILD